MDGRSWPLCAAAVKGLVFSTIIAGLVSAQDIIPYQTMDPAYLVATEKPPQTVETNDDLARRVAELEKALAQMKEKEQAAAKKSAGQMSVNLGGRLYVDSVFFGQSDGSMAAFGDAQDTVQLRTARLTAFGKGFDVFDYQIVADFASRDGSNSQRTSLKDAYIGVDDLPWLGRVQVGHFKEPFSLEELTSNRFITFMERSSFISVFVPSRNVGVAAYQVSENERMTLAFGGFREVGEKPPYVADDDGGYAFTARVTYLPWYDEATQGRGLLHLGLGYSFRDVDNPMRQLRARPEVNEGPYLLDTGVFGNVEDYQLLNPEMAFVYGPFSVQSEYLAAFYNRAGGEDPTFHGVYVQTGYFLTGEHRFYNRKKGAFERVKPFENFFRVRTSDGNVETGLGAWELAYRYSWLDLDDKDVLGGTMADHSFGINWYWNPYMRLMFNYVHAQVSPPRDATKADFNVFQFRAQVDF